MDFISSLFLKVYFCFHSNNNIAYVSHCFIPIVFNFKHLPLISCGNRVIRSNDLISIAIRL